MAFHTSEVEVHVGSGSGMPRSEVYNAKTRRECLKGSDSSIYFTLPTPKQVRTKTMPERSGHAALLQQRRARGPSLLRQNDPTLSGIVFTNKGERTRIPWVL